jgi:hypothetical protein
VLLVPDAGFVVIVESGAVVSVLGPYVSNSCGSLAFSRACRPILPETVPVRPKLVSATLLIAETGRSMVLHLFAIALFGLVARVVAFHVGIVACVVASDHAADARCTRHLDVELMVLNTRSLAYVILTPSSTCAVGKRRKAFHDEGEA